MLYVEEDGNSKLILAPNFDVKKEEKKIVIDVGKKPVDRVKEEIYRVYTDGADVIKLDNVNIDKMGEEIRKIMNNLLAVEVIEQTGNTIIAKNFLNIEDVNVKDVIRRVDIILRSMLKDSIDCVDEKKSSLVVKRDVDVNRLCFMLLRILKAGMNNPEVSRKIGVSGMELLHVWYMIINMEAIGDEVKRIARFLNNIELNEKQKKEFRQIYLDIEKVYLDVMKAYYKNDKELAFEVSFKRDLLLERCSKFFEKNNNASIGGMMEKMKALISWIKSISMVAYE